MMVFNAFLLALSEIRRNLLRSFLTVLGIIIGVAAVIIMVTVGRGATTEITSQIEDLGSNMLVVIAAGRTQAGAERTRPTFDEAEGQAIKEQIPNITGVSGLISRAATAVAGNENWTTTVTGVQPDYFLVRGWNVAQGRAFQDSEYRSGKGVCLLGKTVMDELFAGRVLLGERIRIGSVTCEVIGVLAERGQSGIVQNQDDVVLMPLRTVQRRLAGTVDLDMITLSVASEASTEKARQDVEYLMRERRHILPGEEDDFSVVDMKEIAETVSSTSQVMTMLLSAVALISLVVGGIGIMNIMLVSVTERTKEIGTRLAIGALERDVLMQFLVEAVVLAILGGLVGIALALGVSFWLAGLIEVPFTPDFGIIALAFLFSALIGVVFGFFPARRAAQMDPIEALRHE